MASLARRYRESAKTFSTLGRGTEVHKEQAIQTIVEKISIAKQIHPKITKYQKHENKKQTLFKHY